MFSQRASQSSTTSLTYCALVNIISNTECLVCVCECPEMDGPYIWCVPMVLDRLKPTCASKVVKTDVYLCKYTDMLELTPFCWVCVLRRSNRSAMLS